MVVVMRTNAFSNWLTGLRDPRASAKITTRIDRLRIGNPGDARPVGMGVSELRIHYGPGYRVYFFQRGPDLIILLGGGDKTTQDQDIEAALALAVELREKNP